MHPLPVYVVSINKISNFNYGNLAYFKFSLHFLPACSRQECWFLHSSRATAREPRMVCIPTLERGNEKAITVKSVKYFLGLMKDAGNFYESSMIILAIFNIIFTSTKLFTCQLSAAGRNAAFRLVLMLQQRRNEKTSLISRTAFGRQSL